MFGESYKYRLTRTVDTEKLADVLNEEEEEIVSFHLRKESNDMGSLWFQLLLLNVFANILETIGLLTLQVVQASGGRVVVLGTSKDEGRLKLVAELGAKETIIVNDIKNGEKIESMKGTYDVAFECSGASPSADNCLHLLKKNRTVCLGWLVWTKHFAILFYTLFQTRHRP